jgi:oxalate---CoA ligase
VLISGESIKRIGSILPINQITYLKMNTSVPFTIRDLLFKGDQDPDRNAIESPGYAPLTYRALQTQMLSVVENLNAQGFHRNDRIAIITPAGPETAVCIISVMAGFTAVPLNPAGRLQEFESIFSRLGIKAIITEKGYNTAASVVAQEREIPVIELIRRSCSAGKFELGPGVLTGSVHAEFATEADIAYIMQTSGTTAESKIVSFTQKQNAISRLRSCISQGLDPTDRCLHIVPYYHGMGINSPLLCPLIAGGTVICTKDFIPSDFFDLLTTYRPTYFTAGPALLQGILKELKKIPASRLRNHSLRYIRSGSGFIPGDVRRELESIMGIPLIEAYSLSETGTISINIPPRTGSVGIPFIDAISIIDENGERLKPHCIGEITIKDAAVFSGYEYAPDAKKTAFINGWFRTGDLGYVDEEGYLFITGRKKEIVNKGGEKISPVEIDAVLIHHPRVSDAMAFGVMDPVLGEDIAAMVVPADNEVTETELRNYLLDHLVQFKVPRRIYFVDAIPKTPTGKPMRYEGTRRYS